MKTGRSMDESNLQRLLGDYAEPGEMGEVMIFGRKISDVPDEHLRPIIRMLADMNRKQFDRHKREFRTLSRLRAR